MLGLLGFVKGSLISTRPDIYTEDNFKPGELPLLSETISSYRLPVLKGNLSTDNTDNISVIFGGNNYQAYNDTTYITTKELTCTWYEYMQQAMWSSAGSGLQFENFFVQLKKLVIHLDPECQDTVDRVILYGQKEYDSLSSKQTFHDVDTSRGYIELIPNEDVQNMYLHNFAFNLYFADQDSWVPEGWYGETPLTHTITYGNIEVELNKVPLSYVQFPKGLTYIEEQNRISIEKGTYRDDVNGTQFIAKFNKYVDIKPHTNLYAHDVDGPGDIYLIHYQDNVDDDSLYLVPVTSGGLSDFKNDYTTGIKIGTYTTLQNYDIGFDLAFNGFQFTYIS